MGSLDGKVALITGASRGQEVSGCQHFECVLARDIARQGHHGRRAEEPDVNARRAEPRRVRRNR